MRQQPLLLISLSLAVFLPASVLAQDQVQIQFQTDPVLAQTGTEVVFTVLTVSQVLSMTWQYKGETLGLWAGGSPVVNPLPQFQGRITIGATQLRIGGAQLRDAGNYTVEVTPTATTGLASNTRSIQLRVFDAVAGVSLFVPTVAVEGRNVSLRCTWTAGTELTVQWGKGGAAVVADSRITISGDSLVINPARRGDAGEYTCTVSNPVSAQTATQSLTVYYGPDTPVLTKDTPKDCVGGGDVLVGQTVRLTCMSDSLPPALFSWQRDGQAVASGQPDSGVLSLQTFSTDESGRYVCTARNAITGGTSEQGTALAIVDTCLNVGEVVGIVIGCLLLIIIIALLIWLIVFLVRRRRAEGRQRDAVFVQKTNPNLRPVPADPQPNGARDLGQGPHPPLYHTNVATRLPERLYATPLENRGNPQNGLLHDSAHHTHSYPHNGIDNPAFTHTDAHNANTQQQNPNILIQAGPAQGGAQPAAVHVSLNALPHTAQQNNNNAQMPTIHVNLNSYGQQTQQDSGGGGGSLPVMNTANNDASQTEQTLRQAIDRMQRGHSYPQNPLLSHIEAGHQDHTHSNRDNLFQQNANTQTYQQELEPDSRSYRNSGRHDTTARSSRRQMPWDRLRGTPAYPGAPESASDASDYTTHPPVREERPPNRSRPQSRAASRSRPPTRQEAPPADRQTRSRSADLRVPNTQLEAARHTQRSPHTQRESAQRDIRGSQTAPRQEATHGNNPQASRLMSQQAPVSRPALSQGPTTQQGPAPLQGADTRALADPNHRPQAHMAQQHRAAPVQKPPQGLGTQTQPVIPDASRPRQGGSAPVLHSPAQSHPSNLNQATLRAHTERAQIFQNRRQQTQATLQHPGPQERAAPPPPPVIPLAQFKTLPKKHPQQHKSPIRGPQPPRPPVNMPVAQRPTHRPNGQHHPTAMPAHRPGNVHRHAHAHAWGHGHPGHLSHPRQQQAHRGRPR